MLLALVDASSTLALARRTRHILRIARLFYQITWTPVAAVARRMKSPLRRNPERRSAAGMKGGVQPPFFAYSGGKR
jgi:hypothetical protein